MHIIHKNTEAKRDEIVSFLLLEVNKYARNESTVQSNY